jgi:hypothetical protein
MTHRPLSALVALVLATSALVVTTGAEAQAPAPPTPAAASTPAAAPTPAATQEAKERFERSQKLYAEGAYEQALIEAQRAYELAPTYKLLFNIGQIQAQLGNYAGALRAFERYLRDGGAEIKADRRALVSTEIESARARTATVRVQANVPGIEVVLDGRPVEGADLAALLVNAGVRKFEARKPGYQPADRVLTLAGGDTVELNFELAEVAPPVVAPVREAPKPVRKVVEVPSYTWIGWVTTGFLAAGALGTGVGAMIQQGSVEDQLGSPLGEGETAAGKREAIDQAESTRFGLALASDILLGSAIVAGGVTLGFVLAEGNEDAATSASIRFVPGLGGATLIGSF